MITLSDLYQNILRNPLDDLPRLLYCDMLEEEGRGQEAEAIRLGIERNNPQDGFREVVEGNAIAGYRVSKDRGIGAVLSVWGQSPDEGMIKTLSRLVSRYPITRILVDNRVLFPTVISYRGRSLAEWRCGVWILREQAPINFLDSGCGTFFGIPDILLKNLGSLAYEGFIRFKMVDDASEWLSRNMISYLRWQVGLPPIQQWLDSPIVPYEIGIDRSIRQPTPLVESVYIGRRECDEKYYTELIESAMPVEEVQLVESTMFRKAE